MSGRCKSKQETWFDVHTPSKTYRFYRDSRGYVTDMYESDGYGGYVKVPKRSKQPRNNPGRYRIPPDYRIPSSYTNRRELYEHGWNTLWDDPTNYDKNGRLKPIHPSYSSTKTQR